MKREIWHSSIEEENRKDSLYMAAEIVKDYAKASEKGPESLDKVLEAVYSKLEEIRKKKE